MTGVQAGLRIAQLEAEVERLRAEVEALKTPHQPDWPHCPCFRCAFVAEKEGRLQAEARLAKVVVLLREIARGAGPFSLDPLEHASNTIDAMKSLAETALAAAQLEEKP